MAARAAAGPQVYVVQVQVGSESERRSAGEEVKLTGKRWEDVGTVTVPARTKRRTIIEQALNTENGRKLSLPVTLRILDADAAREFPVGLKPRDPELVIG